MSELRRREGVAARALEFTILNASRTGEVVGAKWSEVTFEERTWVVPAARCKNNEAHAVALSSAAVSLLKALPREENNDHIFIGGKKGTGLSNMAMLVLLQTRMRQDFFEFRPRFKLVIIGNNRPNLNHVDEAMQRRLHLIPFNVIIPEGERDRDLPAKLEKELPGILAWMIEGAKLWHRDGLNPPSIVRAATKQYFETEDLFAAWARRALYLGCRVSPRIRAPAVLVGRGRHHLPTAANPMHPYTADIIQRWFVPCNGA